jgi:hypothetical protein
VKPWRLFEWRWVNNLARIKGFCEPHLCFVIASTTSILKYWNLVYLWYTSLVFHEAIVRSIPRLYTTMAFSLVRGGQLPWFSWAMTLLTHSGQSNEFLEVRIGEQMVYFSGFPWSHCTFYSKIIWYRGD